MGMNFLSPAASVWALWAVPIVLFYAWRVRAPRYQVSTGRLWAQVLSSARPRWRWRHPASLAVQLLILLTLVAALAQPCWRLPAPAASPSAHGDADDLHITRLAARRDPLDPKRCQVLAEVRNRSGRASQCRIEFELDRELVEIADVELAAHDRWNKVYQFTSRDGGRLTVRLHRPDGRPAGDSATLVLPSSGIRRVVLVEREKGSLRRALESNPRVELIVADAPPAPTDGRSLLVLNRTLADQIPIGPALVVDPAGSCPWWELGDPLPDAVVARQDDSSPLLAHVSLVGLRLAGARRLSLTEKARPLGRAIAWAADGSALAYEIAREGGRLAVFSGNVESSDLGTRAALPIFMANAVAHLTREGAEQPGAAAGSGELFPIVQAEIVRPQPSPDLGASATGRASLVNSSTPAPIDVPLWPCLVGTALVMLVLEWILYQRRWTC